MVHFKVQGLLAVAYSSVVAAVACTSDLLVDDLSNSFSTSRNNLGFWTSDDGSMASISASGGILSFTPRSGAYYYETFPCQALQSNSYTHVQLDIKAPVSGAAFTAQLKWAATCSATTTTKTPFRVTGLTGNWQTLRIPLSSFAGANLNAALSFVIESFSSNQQWQLDKVSFVCGSSLTTSTTAPTTAPSTSTSTPNSSTTTSSTTTLPITSSFITSTSTSSTSTSSTSTSSTSTSSTSTSSTSTSSRSTSSTSTSSTSTSSTSTSSTSTSSTSTSSTSTSSTSTSVSCSPLLVDDWASQSRLSFLGYNALLLPTGDDGTMQSMVISNYHITLTPKSTSSYFFTQFGCVDATKYGGIALRIKAQAATTFTIELSSQTTCGGEATAWSAQTTAQLGWTFDGTEKLYSFPWSKFSGLDPTKLRSIVFEASNHAITLGPLALYCGSTPTAWPVPTATTTSSAPTETVPAPAATVSGFVIDTFSNRNTNALGSWHGGDDLSLTWGTNRVTIVASAPDYRFTTQLSDGCRDMRSYSGSYLHIAYSGHLKFSVSLQQHNSQCSESVAPFPETRDSVEAARYATGNDIYIPISHFNINLQRGSSVAVGGIYTSEALVLTKIEIVPSIPSGVSIPAKLPSGTLVFACTRPNSFAFGIDDGSPQYAASLAQIVRDAGIKVTFFTLGAVLEDTSSGLASFYQQLKSEGHQIAMHSYTHPRMEGLPDIASIDWEYNQDFRVMNNVFGERSSYFRPPYGVDGARMRERWTAISGSDKPYIINWSVDVEDWLWAETDTPEKQIDSFKSDLAKGGNLAVMHYSYNSTVSYFPEFIRLVKDTGKQIMRVDQCMEDPNAPPL